MIVDWRWMIEKEIFNAPRTGKRRGQGARRVHREERQKD